MRMVPMDSLQIMVASFWHFLRIGRNKRKEGLDHSAQASPRQQGAVSLIPVVFSERVSTALLGERLLQLSVCVLSLVPVNGLNDCGENWVLHQCVGLFFNPEDGVRGLRGRNMALFLFLYISNYFVISTVVSFQLEVFQKCLFSSSKNVKG